MQFESFTAKHPPWHTSLRAVVIVRCEIFCFCDAPAFPAKERGQPTRISAEMPDSNDGSRTRSDQRRQGQAETARRGTAQHSPPPGRRAEPRPTRRASQEQTRTRVRIAHKTSGEPIRAGGLHWDKISRYGLMVALAAVAMLYIGPTKTYLQQRDVATEQRAEMQLLSQEHWELKRRAKALRRDATIEMEARKLGMVKPDERPFVVEHAR